jgi:hypothetical protein
MRPETAYVSAAFGDWLEARAVQKVLIFNGYIIQDDWTLDAEKVGSRDKEWTGEISHEDQLSIAGEHIKAATTCNRHVLVCGPTFKDCFGGIGEFFLALNSVAQCDVIAPPRNSVFFHLPNVKVFESFDKWKESMN